MRLREHKRLVAEPLGLTHVVDDRWSILRDLEMCRRYLFASAVNDCDVPIGLVDDGEVVCGTWHDVLADLGLNAS